VTFSLHENDRKLVECGKNKVMEVMRAAGAQEVVQEARYAHLVGGARMGRDLRNSVVDGFGRTDDIANLLFATGAFCLLRDRQIRDLRSKRSQRERPTILSPRRKLYLDQIEGI
jgi:hypothetical protein